jgi:hypothetical protein
MSLNSVIMVLDKFADKEVSNIVTLKAWFTEAQTVLATLPVGILQVQAESGLDALLPFINLIQADLTPIATILDKAAAAIPMTGAQAATVAVAVVNAVVAAGPAVSAAASTAADAVKSDLESH